MANYLKYSDIPIFANFIEEFGDPISSSAKNIFAATEASLALDLNVQPNRYLGKLQIRNDFSVTGPLEGKFSLTFFPLIERLGDTDSSILNIQKENQLAFFKLTGDFQRGHTIRVSNFLLKRCYLQSYSVKINAYQPISISANFTSYDVTELSGQSLTKTEVTETIAKNSSVPYYEGLHALTTIMGGSITNIPETKVSIDINVDCNRAPIYGLGDKVPYMVSLNSVERTTTIQGENIGAVMDLSGVNPGATDIYFMPLSSLGSYTPSEADNVLKFDINGRIVSQQISTSQNSIVNGRVVIKEIIL